MMYECVKKGTVKMSARSYNLSIGLILLYGFIVNMLMCQFCTEIFMQWNFAFVVIGYFAVALTGIAMNAWSKNPIISFIGYNLLVLPVGVILSIALTDFDHISIMNTLATTTIVTIILIVLASYTPDIFLSMGKVLFVCLLGVIICEVVFIFLGISTPSLWNFGVALIFCGFIGFDWAEAQLKEHTLDNAIDSAMSLYLDIINLFIRILSLKDSSSNSK